MKGSCLAQRLEQRTRYDIEMLLEMGYCNGSKTTLVIWTGVNLGSTIYLLDFFPEDFLLMVDGHI